MPAKKKTAILVIHGVGPHTSFQACDSFIQGFCSTFTGIEGPEKNEQVFKLQHKLKLRREGGMPWVQNYVSFPVPGKERDETIDFYEYFWDIYMVHKASFNDAFKMLSKASKSASEFYKEFGKQHPDILVKATDVGEFGRKRKFGLGKPEFRPAGYLKLLGPLFAFIAIISPYMPGLLKLLDIWSETRLPILKQLFGALGGFMKEQVPDFIGDLVRYLDLNPRSELFEIRRNIINGSLDELRALLKDDSYKEIIIAGHSLGSVIAYDALNRVIQEVSVEEAAQAEGKISTENMIKRKEVKKITGFISFGSPLDKIALFFREHVKKNKRVQREVLANLRGFRSIRMEEYKTHTKPGDKSETELRFDVSNPIGTEWDKSIKWLNFYHKQDIISGKLDLYNLKDQPLKHQQTKVAAGAMKEYDGNIEITDKFRKSVAHGCYWGKYLGEKKGTNQMHKAIIEEFFK